MDELSNRNRSWGHYTLSICMFLDAKAVVFCNRRRLSRSLFLPGRTQQERSHAAGMAAFSILAVWEVQPAVGDSLKLTNSHDLWPARRGLSICLSRSSLRGFQCDKSALQRSPRPCN